MEQIFFHKCKPDGGVYGEYPVGVPRRARTCRRISFYYLHFSLHILFTLPSDVLELIILPLTYVVRNANADRVLWRYWKIEKMEIGKLNGKSIKCVAKSSCLLYFFTQIISCYFYHNLPTTLNETL